MAESNELNGDIVDAMEIKVEPVLQLFPQNEQENNFVNSENSNAIAMSGDAGALTLWTSKATMCLISQYKKYRSMVGQSTHLRSLREMFEMISVEMQKYGFYFSPQKCENKWRVLERKYKKILYREKLKKPGRMRHIGQWEYKKSLDEIFTDKIGLGCIEENNFVNQANTRKNSSALPAMNGNARNLPNNQQLQPQQQEDLINIVSVNHVENERNDELQNEKGSLTSLFEKFFDEMTQNFMLAEKNKERRHKEKMAIRQSKLDVQKKLLKLKEQKLELEKSRIIAAAQHLHLNM